MAGRDEDIEMKLVLDDKNFVVRIESAGKLIREFGDNADLASDKIGKLEKALKQAKDSLIQFNQQASAGKDALKSLASSGREFATAIVRAASNLNAINSRFQMLNRRASGLSRSLNSISRSSNSFNVIARSVHNLDRRTSGLLSTSRDLLIVYSALHRAGLVFQQNLVDSQLAIINANADLERMTALMQGMSSETTIQGAQNDAVKQMDWTIQKAKEMPFALHEIANASAKLKSVGIDPTAGAIEALGEAISNVGGDSQSLHRATIAIQQMAGKGVVSMEELRQQLGEAMPKAMAIMASSMNLTIRELVEQVSKGQVAAESAINKMLVGFSTQLAGSSERMMHTWTGLVSRMITEWLELLKTVGSSSIDGNSYFQTMKDNLEDLVEFMGSKRAKYLAGEFGKALTTIVVKGRELFTTLADNWDKILGIGRFAIAVAGIRMFVGALGTMRNAFVASVASSTMFFNGIQQSIRNIGLANTAMVTAGTRVSAMGSAVALAGRGIAGLVGPIGIAILAIQSLIWAFQNSAEAAIRASKDIDESYGASASRIGADRLIKGIEDRLNDIQRVELQIEKLENSGVVSDRVSRLIEEKKQEILGYQKEVQQFRNSLSTATEVLTDRDADLFVSQQLRQIRASEAIYAAEYNEQVRLLDEKLKLAQKEEEKHAIKLERIEALNKFHANVIESIEAKLHETRMKYIRATDEANVLKYSKMINQLTDARNEAEEERKRNVAILSEENDLTHKTFSGPGPLEQANQLAKNLEKQLANVRAQLATPGDSGIVAKTKVDIDFIRKFAQEAQFTNDEMELALSNAQAYANQISGLEAFKKGSEYLASLQRKFSELNATMDWGVTNAQKWSDRVARGAAGPLAYLSKNLRSELIQWASMLDKAEATVTVNQDAKKRLDEMMKASAAARVAMLDEKEQQVAAWEEQQNRYREFVNDKNLTDENRKKYLEEYFKWEIASRENLRKQLESPMDKLNREWQDTTERMKEATVGWANNFTEAMVNMFKTGKFEFSSFIESILTDLARMSIQKSITGPLFAGLSNMITDQIGGSGFSNLARDPFPGASYKLMGGIGTPYGDMELKKYAMGGIAKAGSRQINVIAEGSKNEAYVPLPDGRSIPVTMSGQNNGPANVSVNLTNESGVQLESQQNSPPRINGDKIILDIVLNAVNKPGSFRNSMKGALGGR